MILKTDELHTTNLFSLYRLLVIILGESLVLIRESILINFIRNDIYYCIDNKITFIYILIRRYVYNIAGTTYM